MLILAKFITVYQRIKVAIVAANISMNATMGIIGLVALAIGGLIILMNSWKQSNEDVAKAAEERLNIALEESAKKFDAVREAEERAGEVSCKMS